MLGTAKFFARSWAEGSPDFVDPGAVPTPREGAGGNG